MRFIIFLLFMNDLVGAFTTCSGGTIGADPPTSFATVTDSSGVGYLLEDEIYQVTCCGYISSWEFVSSAGGTVVLQIWRKTGVNSYTLIGKNEQTIGSAGTQSISVPATERIYVQHGDLIGWYASTNIIMHLSAASYPVTNRYSSTVSDLSVGEIHDWSSEEVLPQIKFAIKATVTASTSPLFTFGSSTTVSIDDTTAADENVLTLSVADDDGDTIVYSTYSNDNVYFYVDTDNGQIRTLQANIPEGTYTVTPMVTDGCYNKVTTVVTITVTNVAITFDGFSEVSATVSEDDYLEKNLTNVLVTEPNDNYYCYLTSSSSFPFIVRQANPLYPNYAIYLQDWPELDFDVKSSYSLTVDCTEAISSSPVSVDGSFTVAVTGNTGPSMTIPTAAVTLDATTDWTGTLVYTVAATDPENDPLTMTLSTSPTNGPFNIMDDGKIVLTSDLIRHSASSYDLTVTVTDIAANSNDQMTIRVTINNINTDPQINNFPTSISVTENEAQGKSIFQVVVTDPDTDTIEIYAAFNPSYGGKLFAVDSSTGVVSTSSSINIDYDVISNHSIEVHITASDGKHFDTQTLTINIDNENETPIISQTYFRIARDEGNANDVFPAIRYDVDDPDIVSVADVVTFSKDCGADDSRVSMTTSDGLFSFNGDYDLDDSSNPTDFTCTVTVTDNGGLTDTCIIDVHVDYVNEFTPTFQEASYSITVMYTELIGTIVLNVNASDNDLSSHGEFYYEILNAQDLFGVFQNGSVFLNADLLPYYPNGHIFTMTLKAVDTGGLMSTVPVTVTIPATTVIAVEYTTETPWTFFEYQMNMATFEVAAVVGLACISAAIYLIWKYIMSSRPVPKPVSPPITPVSLPQLSQTVAGQGNFKFITPQPNGVSGQMQTEGILSAEQSQGEGPTVEEQEPKTRIKPLFDSSAQRQTVEGNYVQSPPLAYL